MSGTSSTSSTSVNTRRCFLLCLLGFLLCLLGCRPLCSCCNLLVRCLLCFACLLLSFHFCCENFLFMPLCLLVYSFFPPVCPFCFLLCCFTLGTLLHGVSCSAASHLAQHAHDVIFVRGT
eukprot:TRINITY_DN4047_c0_g1_i2.p1 TRINITY_DN4047_c0_g1~~TRINITY_DN4047_c0_g1_i2.p1  ORF type:complete len:120 (+),score=20.07 TRINITY_DN4047_c0_g1_i2:172-531(+)